MECPTPISVPSGHIVSCGRCPFCMATRRSDWATRLHYEAKSHLVSSFVTLTYATGNLTYRNGNSQLVKSDLQNFFKRLRKSGEVVRYYAVGEYGSLTYRPHYHILLFGCDSESVISKAWGLGEIHVGKVTQASIAYCLRYIINGKSWKMTHHRARPFSLMSRGRGAVKGLGFNYLTPQMISWHKSDKKNYVLIDGKKRHLPRYYKSKIFSAIDHVRIAVRDSNAAFKRQVAWLRSPAMRNKRDPIGYRNEQLRRLAYTIRAKTKENLII